ncbi:MAG: HD domain-containing phosphohydrolase [Proteocatella sp.]
MMHEFYDSMLSLNENFPFFIKSSPIFENSTEAHFLFLDTNRSKIIYQYDHKIKRDFSDPKYKEIHDTSPLILEKNRINYRIWNNALGYVSDLPEDSNSWLAISVYHPLSDSQGDYIAVVLLSLKDISLLDFITSYLNEDYLFQTCMHVNMVLNNYEKLFPLIDTFVEILTKRDVFMPHHMTNVAGLCLKIALKLNLTRYETVTLHIAALLHDIGKIYISDQILNKHDPLDDSEYIKMKSHCIKGSEILNTAFYDMALLKDIPKIIRHHHENFDGSGYPDQLSGYDIPYLSRIVHVANFVDVLLSKNNHKENIEANMVIKELKRNSGSQFDPLVVNTMIEVLKENNLLDATALINEYHFIPKAVLSFFYKDYKGLISLCGNLIIENNEAKFLIHPDDNLLDNFNPEYIYKCTFSFFNQRIIYEYNATVMSFKDNCFLLKNIIFMPSDKFFSIGWDSQMFIKPPLSEPFAVNTVTLGVDIVIFKTTLNQSAHLIEHFNEPIKAHLEETLEDINVSLNTDLKIVKYYKSDVNTVFVCQYEGLTALQRDMILKLLFRKQVLLRKSKVAPSNDL